MAESEQTALFTRQSSGLIRLGSPFRTYMFNVGFSGLTYTAYLYALLPGNYPGASLFGGLALAIVGFTALSLVYALLSATMPRSGGDYVYVSRAIHPAVGFAANFAQAMCYIFWIAQGAFLTSQFIFSSFFSTLGSVLGSGGLMRVGALFATPLTSFIVGTILIALFGVMVSVGMESYYRFQTISFVIGAVCMVATFAVLLVNGHSDFVASFNQYAQSAAQLENGYQVILDRAHAAGFNSAGHDWAGTLGVTGIALLTGMGTAFIGGEVKTVRKSQLFGMLGGTLTTGAVVLIIAALLAKTVGLEFNGAASYLWLNSPDQYPLPIAPLFTTWATVLSGGVLTLLLVMVGFVIWSYFFLPQNIIVVSRMMLAWSLDRLVPGKLGAVSKTRFTPVTAIVTVCVLAEIMLAIYAFTPFFSALAPLGAFTFAMLAVSITAVIFPFNVKTREIYRKSGVTYTVAGIPLITLAGSVSLAYWLIALYYEITHPELGYNNPVSIGFTAAVVLIPAVLYLIARLRAARDGLDLDKTFGEIPPE